MYKEKAKFFDCQIDAEWADAEYTGEEIAKVEKIFDLCKIEQGSKVIEPGCGSGRLTQLLAERCGAEGEVFALDISPKMIEKAKQRLKKHDNVKILCELLENVEIVSEGYDAVVCHQVFPHFENKEIILNKLVKALKPGGYLIISHLIGIEEINDVHRKSNSPVENDIMPSNDDIKKMFAEAGLELIFLEDEKNCYNVLGRKKETEKS